MVEKSKSKTTFKSLFLALLLLTYLNVTPFVYASTASLKLVGVVPPRSVLDVERQSLESNTYQKISFKTQNDGTVKEQVSLVKPFEKKDVSKIQNAVGAVSIEAL